MKAKKGLIIIESALLLSLLVIFTVSMCDFGNGCENIYDNMLRLHVIANSDSEKDQALKLSVRDEVLLTGKSLFDGSVTKDSAKSELETQIPILESAAEKVLRKNGCYDKVKISFGKTYFNTRKYENFTVPAGFYDAIRVEIGNAEGQNWWCVMFPPLCLPAVSDGYEDAVFNSDGKQVLDSDIKLDVRFKVVEMYQATKKIIKNIVK